MIFLPRFLIYWNFDPFGFYGIFTRSISVKRNDLLSEFAGQLKRITWYNRWFE